MILKLYAGQDIFPIENSNHWILTPFKPSFNPSTYIDNYHHLTDYHAQAHSLIQLTSLENSDAILYPFDWNDNHPLDNFFKLLHHTQTSNKKILIFYGGDNPQTLANLPRSLFLKHSIDKSKQAPNEIIIPFYFPDLLTIYLNNSLPFRQKQPIPTVGFCGNAIYPQSAKGPIQHLKRLHQILRYHMIACVPLDNFLRKIHLPLTSKPGSKIRAQSILISKKSPLLNSNFIIRDTHCNGVKLNNSPEDIQFFQQTKLDFINNTLNSDYILCPRGVGNFSVRLYDTLCLGRIPVFINTDSILPFENLINWKDHCIWVEEHQIQSLPQIIRSFHNNLSNNDFLSLQKNARNLWLQYFSFSGFFKNFHKLLPSA